MIEAVLKSVSKLRTFEKIYVVPILEEMEWWSQDHMGWLRIMCPGSVIGEQRRYLCALERPPRLRPATAPAPFPVCCRPPRPAAAC